MMDMKVDLDGYCTPDEYLSESSMIGSRRDRRKIMKAASDLMDGERAKDYGDALEMHRRIAVGWTEILGVDVKPHEAALCMAWLKIARLVETPGHEDSYVDLVAYGSLAGEIQARDSAKRG
jgi:hypothetical protein